jgi:hypothetical protein
VVAEKAVVVAIPVRGVAENGMKDVFHVASELMLASGQRFEGDEGVAGCRIAPYGFWDLRRGELEIFGNRLLGGFVRCGHAVGGFIDFLF